ncbi:MAG: hypothetical protein KDJ36_17620 [Hyphomicrobiaceae bacterium]|nr:hypothetical protein [Hyphomicrobiaceae bacterium]
MWLWKILPGSIQSPPPRKPTKGDEIRARIEANRRKRLAIAESMKAEAGVVEHNVWEHEFAGLAELENGRIHSPEGRNMRQLYIVAHECGHIFLHTSEPGIRLPTHVMELEAETYAHHAFRQHGMRVPRDVTEFARDYVASWIARDREAGCAIDQRALDFAMGVRSPFEPLRMVPSAWQHGRVEEDVVFAEERSTATETVNVDELNAIHEQIMQAGRRRKRHWLAGIGAFLSELGGWLWRSANHVAWGMSLYVMARISAPLTGLPLDGVKPDGDVWPLICSAAAAGLVWAGFAISVEIALWGRRYRRLPATRENWSRRHSRSVAFAVKSGAVAYDNNPRYRPTGGKR